MLRKLIVPALALLALPAFASAQFEAGDMELTLSGFASGPKDLDGYAVGMEGSIGYFLTKEAEVSFRQSLNYVNNDADVPGTDDSDWGGRSLLAFDYHFDFGALQPFVGVFGGYDYPNGFGSSDLNVDDDPVVGPEAGAKYFVNGTTFIFANLGYFYNLDSPSDSYFEGKLGVGFRF